MQLKERLVSFYGMSLSKVPEKSKHSKLSGYVFCIKFNLCGLSDTVKQLLDKTYYPRKDRLGDTPKLRCVYQDVEDNDMRQNHNGCQRLYFMSMSKAMAKQCKGEVFLMTMTDLAGNKEVPENGIWWQVEFPTLIDPNRENKITKVSAPQHAVVVTDDFRLRISRCLRRAQLKSNR